MASGFTTIWLDSVDSTNSEVVRRKNTLDNLSVIAAKDQTAGKGQRGNSWQVEPGANLTFSILLRFGEGNLPAMAAREQFSISMVTTVALHDYFASRGIGTRIKWPNDIYYRDKKLTGILIENSLEGGLISTSVVGIGINVNQKDFPPQLLNPVSMSVISGKNYDPVKELDAFMSFFVKYLDMAGSPQGRKEIKNAYLSRLYRLGESFQYTDCRSGEVFSGKITGITSEGRLLVEKADGSHGEYSFKEISYIL